MTENMKAFMDAIQSNEELKEKVIEIDKKAEEEPEKYIDEYIAVAKEYGISLTREDFLPEQPDTSEITDDELQAVTGGDDDDNSTLGCIFLVGTKSFWAVEGGKGKCFCAVIGAAKGCGCVAVGTSS